MQEKANVPAIRFAGFTDAWEQRKLGECFSERVESMPGGELISVTINEGIKRFAELGRHDNSNEDKSKYKKVCIGDIAYNSMRMWQGASGYSPYEGIVSPAYTVLTPNPGINSQCLAYHFKLPEMIHTFQINSQGITSDTWNLKFPALSEIEIFVSADEREQEKIATFFRNLDHLITLHQRKCSRLCNIKKSMLERMFPKEGASVPEIRFAGFTDAWEQRELGELGTITTGSTPSTSISDYYSDDGIVWVTPTDISENITWDSTKKLSKLGQRVGRVVPKNTILVTCIASIGKNTMLGATGSFNQQINGLTPNENKYDPYFLLTESFLWSAQMKNSAAAGTMQIVNRTEFSELKTRLPTLTEQQQIGAFFRHLDHLITLHQRELERLQNIKKACLEKMFV
ncbi:MAG: restriction endonuclease subunit S [Angelakisella sp.]|jgi:type I restriction enzyme S subunit|nr:restriction endonuclease subunit S [Angelakisella sp.]